MAALAYARSELRFERVSWCGKTEFPILKSCIPCLRPAGVPLRRYREGDSGGIDARLG
jgi:hypothetical protein